MVGRNKKKRGAYPPFNAIFIDCRFSPPPLSPFQCRRRRRRGRGGGGARKKANNSFVGRGGGRLIVLVVMCVAVCLQRRPPELSTLRKYRLISITIYRRGEGRYSQRGGGRGLPYFLTTLFFESATPRGLSRRRRLFDEDINGNYGHVSPRFQRAAVRPPPCYWHAAAKRFFPALPWLAQGGGLAVLLSKHRGASLETMSSFSFLFSSFGGGGGGGGGKWGKKRGEKWPSSYFFPVSENTEQSRRSSAEGGGLPPWKNSCFPVWWVERNIRQFKV